MWIPAAVKRHSVLMTLWIILCCSPASTVCFWRNMRHRQLHPNPAASSSSASMPVSSRSAANNNSPALLFGGTLSLGGLLSGSSALDNAAGSDHLWYRQRPAAVRRPPTFSCQGLKDGVYADVEADCRVYHRCAHGFRQTYYCDDDSKFDTSTESCESADNVECSLPRSGEHRPFDAHPRHPAPSTEVLAPARPPTPILVINHQESVTETSDVVVKDVVQEKQAILSDFKVSSNVVVLTRNDTSPPSTSSSSVSHNLCLTCVKPQCYPSAAAGTTIVGNFAAISDDDAGVDADHDVKRFPVLGSQCRAYFECRHGTTDADIYLCPTGEFFDLEKNRCSSELPSSSANLPSCSTSVAAKDTVATLIGPEGDVMFAVCFNSATIVAYGVCPKASPIYDSVQKVCKTDTSFDTQKTNDKLEHQHDKAENKATVPSVSTHYSVSFDDSRKAFDPSPMHVVVAHVDSRHPGSADVEEQLMMMENEDESALTLLTPNDVMNNDHRYSFVSSYNDHDTFDVGDKKPDEDEDDDTSRNGDDDEVRCMELPDGVYVMSSESNQDAQMCAECRRGVRTVEFPCDSNHDSSPSSRRWTSSAHKSAPKNFCAGRDPGVYADVTQSCESFVVCRRFRAPVRGYCPGDYEKFDDSAGRGCIKGGSCANFQVLSSSSSHISPVVAQPSSGVHGRHGTSAVDMTAAEANNNNHAHGTEIAVLDEVVNTPEALLAEEQVTRADNLCADGRVGFFPDIKSDCTKYYMCMPGGVHMEQECAPGLIFDTASQLCKDEKFAVCIEPIPLPMPVLNCSEVGPGYHFQFGSDCKVWTLCPPGDEEQSMGSEGVQPKLGTGRGGAAAMAMTLSSVVPPYLLRPFSSPATPGSASTFRQLSATLARFQGLRASRLLRMNGSQRFEARTLRREGQTWQCPTGTRIDRIRLICRSEEKVSCPVAAAARSIQFSSPPKY